LWRLALAYFPHVRNEEGLPDFSEFQNLARLAIWSFHGCPLVAWHRKPGSCFFCPSQAPLTLLQEFLVHLGHVRLRVPRPGVFQGRWRKRRKMLSGVQGQKYDDHPIPIALGFISSDAAHIERGRLILEQLAITKHKAYPLNRESKDQVDVKKEFIALADS
jgi:hypothetical protein